jgi:glycosyltransferase involved in cell wall biosynthesis
VVIVNLSEFDPRWTWLEASFSESERNSRLWEHCSDQTSQLPLWLPRRRTLARMEAGWRAAGQLKGGDAVLVTHGPRPAMYGALAANLRGRARRHLAFSFNFTDLPIGVSRRVMARAFRRVDRFIVFSTMERQLYAEYFDLPIERFDMLHWGVRGASIPADAVPMEAGDYICAIGSQARDYAVLFDAMRRVPSVRLVIVATPQSLGGLSVPDNVRVLTNIPNQQAMNILAFSRFMVLPLRHSKVPCGHVSLVSAMYLGKAVLCTDSTGVSDYMQPEITGRVMPPRDPVITATLIQGMLDDHAGTQKLGAAGREFALTNCSERNTIDFFTRYLATG